MQRYVTLFFLCAAFWQTSAQVIPVIIEGSVGNYQVIREGQPYFIKGGGGDRQLATLVAAGGNSIRTWGTYINTIDLLNEAHSLGITVLMGLWVGHEQHGFDYNNEAAIQAQLAGFRSMVQSYRNHPAVLAWGIGNEVELGVANYNPKVWNAINEIALMIKQEDGNHPTLTVVAGIDVTKATLIKQRAPDLDMLGVNAYGGIGGVDQTLQTANWNKPYLITEWGPNGQWESPKTNWGAPLEASSTDKAALYKSRYQNSIAAHPGKCLGSYVFLWSDKFEQTPTWYGLFLPNSSDRTQAVEEMQKNWSGSYPLNRAPRITSATIEGKTATQNPTITKDTGNLVTIQASDPDGDDLTFEYLIQSDLQTGMTNSPPATIQYIPGLVVSQNGGSATFIAPDDKKNYRLFIFVRDGKGNAATINVPFTVSLQPLVSLDSTILFASKDCYVRDGEFATSSLGITDRDRLQARRSDSQGLSREAYVGFNVSTVNSQILHVWLELYGVGPEGTMVAAFPLQRNDWTEAMAWNNRKTTASVALDTVILTGGSSRYVRWDVTSYVNKQRFFKKDSVSFVIRHLNATDNPSTWLSREARPAPPRLVFELIEGNLILGVEDEIEISLYPNPAKTKIYFTGVSNAATVLIKLAGSKGEIFAPKFNAQEKSIELDGLSSGVYIIEIKDSGKIVMKRFVKI